MRTLKPGQLAAARRRELGLTQAQLASAANVNRTAIAGFETGGCGFGPVRAKRLAEALGLDARDLVRPELVID